MKLTWFGRLLLLSLFVTLMMFGMAGLMIWAGVVETLADGLLTQIPLGVALIIYENS